MSINPKIIIRVISDEKTITFSSLYRRLKKNRPGFKRQRLRKLLKKLKNKSKILYIDGGKRIAISKLYQGKIHKANHYHPARDFNIIIKRHNLNPEFPKEVLEQAFNLSNTKITNKTDKTDFTKQNVITIDGEDSKDFDDAVYLKKEEDKYILYVHIADVSFYVREKSKLDLEAYKRGNSVYLVDKVIPMLPHSLSNGICSLNPGKKRYTISVEMTFDKKGNLVSHNFYDSVIISKRRFTYKEVEKTINIDYDGVPDDIKPFYEMLLDMKELSTKLTTNRMEKGSLNMETKELYITVNKESMPTNIEIRKRLLAHKIIEEFMLISNVVVSSFLDSMGISIYRVHESPDVEKIERLNKIINKYGFHINKNKAITPKIIQKILNAVSNHKEKQIIHMHILRTMKQAYYTTENKGHFGLAFTNYTHFTSPIRRYPDLLIHRLLKYNMGTKIKAKQSLQKTYLEKAAENSSKTERLAVDAERDIVKRKASHFMVDKIGNIYDAIISGITSFGFFVEIAPYGVEGLCGLNSLKYHYEYNENENILYGTDNKNIFSLGKKIKVKLVNVNVRKSFIDFELVNE